MSLRSAIKSLFRQIHQVSRREFQVAVFVCVIIGAISALVLTFGIGYADGYDSCPCQVPVHRSWFYEVIRLKIILAILVIAIALWTRKVFGLCISVMATVFIGSQYGVWYLDTQRWLREMGVTHFSQMPLPSEWPNFGGLYMATPWDTVVLVVVTALFAWQVRVLITLVTSARQHKRLT